MLIIMSDEAEDPVVQEMKNFTTINTSLVIILFFCKTHERSEIFQTPTNLNAASTFPLELQC